MDLKNKRITVRELLENPKSKAVFERRFADAMKLPIVAMSGSLSLDRALKMVSAYIPPKVIEETLKELEAL